MLRDQLGAELVETVTPATPTIRGAERRVHVRGCAVRDPAALHAGDLRAPRREGRALLRRAGPRRDLVRLSAEALPPRSAADAGRQHHELRELRRRALPRRPVQRLHARHQPLSREPRRRADQELERLGREREVPAGRVARRRRELDRVERPHRIRARRPCRAQLRRAARAARRSCTRTTSRCSCIAENTVPTPKIQGPNVGPSASTASRRSSRFRASPYRPARPTSSTSRLRAERRQEELRLVLPEGTARRSCRIRCPSASRSSRARATNRR